MSGCVLAVGADHAEVVALAVHAARDQVRAQVAVVLVEHVADHGHEGRHPGLAAAVQPLQLQVGRDEQVHELRVGRSASAAAVDVGRDRVDLLAVLLHHDGPARRPRVGSQHHAVLEQ